MAVDLAAAQAELDILRTPQKNPMEQALAAEKRRREVLEAEVKAERDEAAKGWFGIF